MGVRRRGREYALQMLFAMDMTEYQPDEVFAGFHAIQDLNRDAFYYARRMVDGIHGHLEEIDALLAKYAKNWKIARMAVVDRNLLRLSIFELKYQEDVPFQIVLNEALEIGKDFSEEESSQFINGILDTASKELRPEEPSKRSMPKKKKVKQQIVSGE
ncbi:MAG: transcription antitermination factor NusB [Holophagaceae bacterium]|nr:transcription antitermination factor NusB [Holophagaceae bacterium]